MFDYTNQICVNVCAQAHVHQLYLSHQKTKAFGFSFFCCSVLNAQYKTTCAIYLKVFIDLSAVHLSF